MYIHSRFAIYYRPKHH